MTSAACHQIAEAAQTGKWDGSLTQPCSGVTDSGMEVVMKEIGTTLWMKVNVWHNVAQVSGNGNYEGESISSQPNLFLVEIHPFFFDVIAL